MGFLVSLPGSFVLLMSPLRTCLIALLPPPFTVSLFRFHRSLSLLLLLLPLLLLLLLLLLYTQALSALVRGGFLVSLLGSFALLMFPLRTCLIELLWGGKDLKGTSGPAKAAAVGRIESQYYAPLTYGILASTVATAVLVPDIWAALSIVGDLASTMQV